MSCAGDPYVQLKRPEFSKYQVSSATAGPSFGLFTVQGPAALMGLCYDNLPFALAAVHSCYASLSRPEQTPTAMGVSEFK
jgi:hypothetical protein